MTLPAVLSRRRAGLLFLLLFVAYNANGRESGSIDTQAAKYLAREVAVRHTTRLNAVIEAQPALGERAAFQRDTRDHWRPAYGVVPGLAASIPATVLHTTGLVDMDAPRAPNLVATLTASTLTALAVTMVYLTVRRRYTESVAWATSVALGLGTNYWAVVSQSLGQHESVAFGMSLALWSWWRDEPLGWRLQVLGAVGLGIAGAARPQIAPMLLIMGGWLVSRIGLRQALLPASIVAVCAGLEVWRNVRWFGHLLGATATIESLHPEIHALSGTLADAPWMNALAMLVSPSRGILIYSPVVGIAIAALVVLCRVGMTRDLKWLAAAAVVQFIAYSTYSVWWGGHSFGPRYTLDILIPLVPFGAVGVVWLSTRPVARLVAILVLVWSVGVSSLGAFVYPNERWNSSPADVDRNHDRLWDWNDSQIARALRAGWHPQNFNLVNRTSIRRDPT